jgi:glycosyltransferase involved in cell wall biosynthesis
LPERRSGARKPKVLFLTHEYQEVVLGGLGRALNGLIPTLEGRVDVDVLLMARGRFRLRTNRDGTTFSEGLSNLIRRERYDILHLPSSSPMIERIMTKARALLPAIKIIHSVHSLLRYERSIRKPHPAEIASADRIIRESHCFHVLTEYSAKELEHSYPHTAGVEKRIIPNGIAEEEVSEFDEGEARALRRKLAPADHKIVLCCSRWTHGKGLEVLVDAVPFVLARHEKVKFVIAGRKEKSWENRVDEYVAMVDDKIEPLTEHIVALGWLGARERNACFSFADLCVMPSLLEYFPYSILEPMMAGIPLVSSRVDGIPEMIREDRECLFVAPNDPRDLADKIVAIVNDDELGKMLARNARERAKRDYGWDRIADMYLEMYASVLSGN